MSEKTVTEESIAKALKALQDLAQDEIEKGHNSRGTATTKVEAMRDGGVGAGSDAGSTQVYHTPSNSDPGTWAGTGQRKSPDDGAHDGISEDGTDYSGSAEMVKSVLEKVAKGQKLDAVEKAVFDTVIKGYGKKSDDDEEEVEKANSGDDPDKKDRDRERTADDEVGKSLSDLASDNPDVSKGFEVSSFLSGWAEVNSDALSHVASKISKSINDIYAEQKDYQAQLAKSVAGLAEVLTLQSQRIEQLESTPARGPKSNVSPVEKSFGAGGGTPQQEEAINKSLALKYLEELVQKGEVSPTELIKYETTNTITPALTAKVRAYHTGRSN